jgi:uncharacterized protein (DUF2267 family)
MKYRSLAQSTGRRLGQRPRNLAKALTEATLRALAQRISGGEVEDLAVRMPEQPRPFLVKGKETAEAIGNGLIPWRRPEAACSLSFEAVIGCGDMSLASRTSRARR